MDSKMISTSPSATVCPDETSIFQTLPAISDITTVIDVSWITGLNGRYDLRRSRTDFKAGDINRLAFQLNTDKSAGPPLSFFWLAMRLRATRVRARSKTH
jgi:hypothetical protein